MYIHSCQMGIHPSSKGQWRQQCSPSLQWSSQPLRTHAHTHTQHFQKRIFLKVKMYAQDEDSLCTCHNSFFYGFEQSVESNPGNWTHIQNKNSPVPTLSLALLPNFQRKRSRNNLDTNKDCNWTVKITFVLRSWLAIALVL